MDDEFVVHAAERDGDNHLHEVVVVGVDIPFWRLVKYAFASIPAMLIVVAVLGIIAMLTLDPMLALIGGGYGH